jgi:hypothetical protein
VEITFSSFGLRDICGSQDAAEESLSAKAARALRMVVADMRAAAMLSEFSGLHNITIDGTEMAIALSPSEFIKFRPGHLHPPLKEGCLDFDQVYRVQIYGVGDHHA